jgi:alpha-tubulin suppressor-like RCC1 family protein
VLVEGLPAVRKLALGGTHACALTEAATVFCWGDNRAKQLGKSAPDRVLSPRLMRGLGAVEQIALGNRSSCFRRNNRTVVCMGSNHLGELGRGISSKDLQTSGSPELVQGIPPVRELEGYADHYCVLTVGDDVYCWGGEELLSEREEARRQRRVDADLPVDPRPTPHIANKMDGLANAQQVAIGLGFSCVLKRNGQVYCWGENSYGQLGSGSQSDRDDPSPVAGVHDATDVWVGSRNACVRDPGGRMLCWGDNRGGQLGNGGYVTALVPTPVMEPPSERAAASE